MMDKAFEIQKKVRDNVQTFQTYLTDLQNWEAEMKRKEAALNGTFEQDLPPVRSKLKKEKPVVVQKKPEKRISAFDYQSWDKFDADKACENVDMEGIGPVSLDSKKSQQAKVEKLREEAQFEKERGNKYVKQEKWDDAISCYSRAIELVKDDAIYFANRGLCYLKKDSLHQAESDCSEALRLDPEYVKALQRRATARERLGSLRAASHDLALVLRLEPHNAAARRQLDAIKARMGTKGAKSKSSPVTTPTIENKPILMASKPRAAKIVELPDQPEQTSAGELWRAGAGEDITVIRPVKKPPHLRSRRSLKHVTIQEILLGKTSPEKPPTRLKIIELDDDKAHGDSNNNDFNKIQEADDKEKILSNEGKGDLSTSPESIKLISDSTATEKSNRYMVPPVNSVQFMSDWKFLKDKGDARVDYLRIINPAKIPSIFDNALESGVLVDVLELLHAHRHAFRGKVAAYLRGLCQVKRFSALAMFLTVADKTLITDLLQYCKNEEMLSANELADLKNKYEI